MKMKDFTPKKELNHGKRLDIGGKRMNIQNAMKRLSFDNKDTFMNLFTHTILL